MSKFPACFLLCAGLAGFAAAPVYGDGYYGGNGHRSAYGSDASGYERSILAKGYPAQYREVDHDDNQWGNWNNNHRDNDNHHDNDHHDDHGNRSQNDHRWQNDHGWNGYDWRQYHNDRPPKDPTTSSTYRPWGTK